MRGKVGMLRRMRCVLKLFGLIVRYKFSRPGKDFWSWLLAIASNNEVNNRNMCIIFFLLADALGRRDGRSVCVLFEQFGDGMNALTLSGERIAEIEAAFQRTGNHHLISILRANAI
jgi:hypothetical protein